MSRCFPFPPPGYEKKPILEDTNALKQEKKEEKKRKKEKKDREKRENKEKKDKERSDGKDGEKKDRKEKHKKEKHRDKKKDKEKDKGKDKEKGSNSETSGVVSVPGTKVNDKIGTKEGKNYTLGSNERNNAAVFHRQNGENNIATNLLSRDVEDSRFVLELARRINDEEKVTTNQFERFPGVEKNKEDARFVPELARRIKDEEKIITSRPERFSSTEKKRDDVGGTISVKSSGNFVVDKGKDKDRLAMEKRMDGKGSRDEVKFSENSMDPSFALPRAADDSEKRMEGKERAKEKDDKPRNKHKGKDGERKSDRKDKDKKKEKKRAEKAKGKKEDKQTEPDKLKNVNQSDFPGSKNGPNNSSNVRSCPVGFAEVMGSLPLSHRNLAIVDGKEKKRKDIDTNGPDNSSNGSLSYQVSVTEVMGSVPLADHRNHALVEGKEKKRKEIDSNGHDNSSNANKSYPVGFAEVMGSVPLSDHGSKAIVEGNKKKRKKIDINGFRHENEVRPNKLLRPDPHDLLENGRKLEAHQSPTLFASERHGHMQGAAPNLKVEGHRSLTPFTSEKHAHIQGASPDLKVDKKEQRKNGLVESKAVSILGPNPYVLNDQVIEKSRKSAHPDTKFLSQILRVPKMDEWSGFDDQEWLFSSQDRSKKHGVGSSAFDDDLQVWSEAVNIESTDIVALPYVLPY